jgi:hypothetical protein
MLETELAEKVIEWLAEQNWTIYQEVQFQSMSSIADIVAVRNGIMWIVETKTAYTLDVMQQAAHWPVHYRSIAVPGTQSARRDYRIAKDYYKVGVITVGKFGEVVEQEPPPLFLRRTVEPVKYFISKLSDEHKTYSKAGSKGGGYLTPYRSTMDSIKRVVSEHPGCTLKELFTELGKCHYASKQSFMGNLLKSLMDFEKDWCTVDCSSKPYRIFIRNAPAPQ